MIAVIGRTCELTEFLVLGNCEFLVTVWFWVFWISGDWCWAGGIPVQLRGIITYTCSIVMYTVANWPTDNDALYCFIVLLHCTGTHHNCCYGEAHIWNFHLLSSLSGQISCPAWDPNLLQVHAGGPIPETYQEYWYLYTGLWNTDDARGQRFWMFKKGGMVLEKKTARTSSWRWMGMGLFQKHLVGGSGVYTETPPLPGTA